jgi:hypothetical protein
MYFFQWQIGARHMKVLGQSRVVCFNEGGHDWTLFNVNKQVRISLWRQAFEAGFVVGLSKYARLL